MDLKQQLQHKVDFKTKPLGSLGKLEQVAIKIGLIQKTLTPELRNPTFIVFAADHGLADEGVSAFPKEVTYQMVMNYLSGGAAINVFCRQNQITLKVVDAGVDFEFPQGDAIIDAKMGNGTKNILKEPAMSLDLCRKTMEKGRQLVNEEYNRGCNIISFGEMGIGNTASAALLMSEYMNLPVEDCTGRGTGHNDEGLKRKIAILKEASAKYQVNTPEDILATFGGFEIAMMCGAMLQAKANGMVMIIDGFIVTSALLAAYHMDKSVLDNCIFSHCSGEKGHRGMIDYLGVDYLLDMGLRLGEGTGAAVAYPLIQSAVAFLNEMASFESAGVSTQN